MRKQIKKKLYDTNTAKKIGTYSNKFSKNDINYISVTLYRKKTGEYFFHKYGGANTNLGICIGNSVERTSGEFIEPIAYKQAKLWAKENLSADDYKLAFCLNQKAKGRVTITVKETDYQRLKKYADKNSLSIGEAFARMVRFLN